MYTIGEVSKKLNIPISTLRYYDREGLFPNLKRENGFRKFSDDDIESLHTIECLKASGLKIKDIKRLIDLIQEGSGTLEKRKEIFETQKKLVEDEISRLNGVHELLEYKCWLYNIKVQDGNEDRFKNMKPEEIKEIYKRTQLD